MRLRHHRLPSGLFLILLRLNYNADNRYHNCHSSSRTTQSQNFPIHPLRLREPIDLLFLYHRLPSGLFLILLHLNCTADNKYQNRYSSRLPTQSQNFPIHPWRLRVTLALLFLHHRLPSGLLLGLLRLNYNADNRYQNCLSSSLPTQSQNFPIHPWRLRDNLAMLFRHHRLPSGLFLFLLRLNYTADNKYQKYKINSHSYCLATQSQNFPIHPLRLKDALDMLFRHHRLPAGLLLGLHHLNYIADNRYHNCHSYSPTTQSQNFPIHPLRLRDTLDILFLHHRLPSGLLLGSLRLNYTADNRYQHSHSFRPPTQSQNFPIHPLRLRETIDGLFLHHRLPSGLLLGLLHLNYTADNRYQNCHSYRLPTQSQNCLLHPLRLRDIFALPSRHHRLPSGLLLGLHHLNYIADNRYHN